MTARGILCVALMVAGAACGDETETPTSPTETGPTAVLFAGTLQPRTSRFYSYTITTAGAVSALLASVESNGAPVTNALEIGLGSPAGTGCAVAMSANVSPALIPQLRHDAAAGTYCVRIADADGAPAALTFTIRVIHP